MWGGRVEPYGPAMNLAAPWRPRLEAWGTSPEDAVLAVAVTVVASSEFGPQWVADPLVAGLMGVPVLLSLAWRRRFPALVAVAVCTFGLLLAVSAPGEFAPQFYFFAVLVAVYSCGAWTTGRRAVLGGAVTFALISVAHIWTGDGDAGDFLPWLVWGAPWFAGRLVRRRTLEAAASGRRAAELEQQRDAAVREVASRERNRIARELHDVVAHAVSVMVVQAGAERLALGREILGRRPRSRRWRRPAGRRSVNCGACSPSCATDGTSGRSSLPNQVSSRCRPLSSTCGRPASRSSSGSPGLRLRHCPRGWGCRCIGSCRRR